MIYNQYTAFTQSKQIKILIITLITLMAMATNMKLPFMAKQTKSHLHISYEVDFNVDDALRAIMEYP